MATLSHPNTPTPHTPHLTHTVALVVAQSGGSVAAAAVAVIDVVCVGAGWGGVWGVVRGMPVKQGAVTVLPAHRLTLNRGRCTS